MSARDVAASLPAAVTRPVPIFSVDVEDWFQVSAFDGIVARSTWSERESRVERNTRRLLDVLAEHQVTGTFFTLGWVAKRFPALVADIAAAGHEVASHGFWHQRIPSLTEAEFREDVRTAKAILEDAAGVAVTGYRAPSFSLTDDVLWAARVLVEEGYQYDSSRFPISRRGYGSAKASRAPHVIDTASGALREFPPAVWSVLNVRIPVAGGGWFRQLPLAVIRRGLAAVLEEGVPAVFYLHPWEIDPDQPRLDVPIVTRIRHYRGLGVAEQRLHRLLGQFAFASFAKSGAL